MPPSTRLPLGIILCGLLYLMMSSAPRGPSDPLVDLEDAGADNATVPKVVNWCRPEECASGRWEPRQPAFTSLDQFQQAYANRLDVLWKGCSAIPDPSGGPKKVSTKGSVDEVRLMQVMNWTWTPYTGELRHWDAEEFMVRLLRSPGGLILIGDSITQQHYHALGYLLNQANLDFDRNPAHLPMHDHKNVRQMLLKPHDALTRRVLERAGVPESRLERPVVTMLEEHMLIGQRDIRAITERLGASKDYYWYHDFQRVPEWEKYVADAVRPRLEEEGSVTEDSILLMNAGAHWSRHELAMLPPRATDREEQARVKETYKQMMKLVIGRVSPIDRLSVFYRSTAPGHPACEQSASPYYDDIAAREAEKGANITPRLKAQVDGDVKQQRARWDWDLFEVHNELWRRAIGGLRRDRAWRRSRTGMMRGARWYYLDLWDVNLQRPDAHSEPGIDCLHWCLPSVLNEWTLHLYHNLFLQSISTDDD
ncbi:hypothetical protein H0H87_002565 [Tephrocybe sp. NHM501043]|nr:hypothetical protein H0H87_002565 [Tephrocybe sp. NHM501043]